MAKLRVYELAKELGLTNKECIDLCNALGYGVKNHSSSLEPAYADQVRRKAEREGLVRDEQPVEEKPVKKAAAKKAPAKKAPAKKAEVDTAPAAVDEAVDDVPAESAPAPAPAPPPPAQQRRGSGARRLATSP